MIDLPSMKAKEENYPAMPFSKVWAEFFRATNSKWPPTCNKNVTLH